MAYCIYLLTFPNGKHYVGQSKNIKHRWCGNGKGYYGRLVGNAIKKYGWDNIDRKIIEDNIDKEAVDERERHYIKQYNCITPFGYNCEAGGTRCPDKSASTIEKHRKSATGVKQSDVTKKRNSISHIKYWENHPEMRAVAATKTKQYFEEHPEARIKAKEVLDKYRPLIYTDEWRAKISASGKGKQLGAKSKRAKAVKQCSLDGVVIKEWACMQDASRELGLHSPGIVACCKGRLKQTGGYTWKYA